jgi:predicted anti-sigma-YlaC factor YlaD
LKRGRHLNDAALAEIWTAAAAGEQAAGGHLDECGSCRARYAAFAAWLDGLRDDAVGEADEAFPAEKLAVQQAHIFRRLEAMERPARVIAFPRFAHPSSAQHSNARRWIAAAAVAGLVIGLAGGQVIDLRRKVAGTSSSFTATASPPRAVSDRVVEEGSYHAVSLTYDEAVLMDISAESTAYAPMPEPLRALDGLTPRARDYVNAR